MPAALPAAVAEGSGSEISIPAADPLAAELAPTEADPVAEPTAMAQPAAAEPEVVPKEEAVVEPMGEKSADPVVEIHMNPNQVEAPACPKAAALNYIHPPAPAQPSAWR